MADQSLAKNFDFKIISDFAGYNSARDKTNIAESFYVQGSQNVYKKLSGNVAVRPGQKRRGAVNTAISPVSSEFVWNTSWGATYPLIVSNSKLQVEYNSVMYDLLTSLTKTRYVFDKWWDDTAKRDIVIFVKGDSDLQYWTGGAATVSSAGATTITKTGSTSWQQEHFDASALTSLAAATAQFDITNPSGTTFRYTYDGTGTDPGITSVTVPVGSYILLGAQNFTAANNGLFVVTGSGTNYFEVTNASGVAENNKTVGTGYIYAKFKKVLIISGTPYAYTGGETTTTLTGVTPSAAAVTGVVFQAVVTIPNIPTTSGFSNDFVKVINNQAYIGSYISRLCYISSNTDFTDYTVPTPRAAGDPELLTLDSTLKGITIRRGNAHIGYGTSEWAEIKFVDITVGTTLTQQTVVDIKPIAKNAAPYAHEFIGNVGDNVVYLSQDQQIRMLGDFNGLFVTGYPSISVEINTELSAEVFTNGALKCIGEFTYLTAPNSGKTYLYQVRQTLDRNGNVVVERMWHAPFIWNLTRVDDIDGVTHGFSNANPQIYQLWDTDQWYDDSPSGEALPYSCVLAMAYRNGGRRQGLIEFDKNFSEGYLTLGTPLNFQVNYNYLGASLQAGGVVNSVALPAYTFGLENASLGDSSLGDKILGDEIDTDANTNPTDLVKFKTINSLPLKNCFEYQVIYSSESVNAQWEILATGTNLHLVAEEQANFIINKKRN